MSITEKRLYYQYTGLYNVAIILNYFVVCSGPFGEQVLECVLVLLGSRVGAVVISLAFHQCVPGSILGPGVTCGLSLLVLYSAPRGFSPGTPVFPSPQKPAFDLI